MARDKHLVVAHFVHHFRIFPSLRIVPSQGIKWGFVALGIKQSALLCTNPHAAQTVKLYAIHVSQQLPAVRECDCLEVFCLAIPYVICPVAISGGNIKDVIPQCHIAQIIVKVKNLIPFAFHYVKP